MVNSRDPNQGYFENCFLINCPSSVSSEPTSSRRMNSSAHGKIMYCCFYSLKEKRTSSILCVHTHCIGTLRNSIEASDAALILLSEDTKRVLFVLLLDILYTTGGTHAPSETTINWASSEAKWRTQYYAPTISVQVVVFCNTEMSQISSPFF